MSGEVITRGQAFANARRVLDAARARRDRDRAAGLLPTEIELIMRRLEREQRQQRPRATPRAAA
ncbi:hypothetical protein OG883_31035 [Streptomyces sp. NBC_01142]|uniref:hypothetical protein n=1 Tax=Streptomyces sp. NBC_01142 TaxID=2975865 RepID=UPI002259D042|nr:hypothetical protein [Streptomyces sp. NBC_01142]MCX4824215.1 hypothetical protein [Streptomyces sp. NBC_01142]